VGLAGCRRAPGPEADAARLASLRKIRDGLHHRLETAVRAGSLAKRVFADRGRVVVAIRSGLIEELAGTVTQRYLDRVTLDLTSVEARNEGAIHKDTFLGRMKVGEWAVDIDITDLRISLEAGKPKVSLRADDRVEIELPVDVKESEGRVGIHFSWDSGSIANLVCKDFDLTRDLRGRVLPQRHVLPARCVSRAPTTSSLLPPSSPTARSRSRWISPLLRGKSWRRRCAPRTRRTGAGR
jgi:hypothetical protein